MQRNISFIIATDFFCWVPFVIVCSLHTLEVLDATPWYAFFSIIILPINSIINPLLYDATITDFLTKHYKKLTKAMQPPLSTIKSSLGFDENDEKSFVNNSRIRIRSHMDKMRSCLLRIRSILRRTRRYNGNVSHKTNIEEIEMKVMQQDKN